MPKPPKGFIFYRRSFLNTPGFETTGAVLASIEDRGYVDFILSDCSRQVSLDLSTHTPQHRRNTLKTLRLIAQAANDLADAIEETKT